MQNTTHTARTDDRPEAGRGPAGTCYATAIPH